MTPRLTDARTKYGAQKVVDARWGVFDSQAEYARWRELVELDRLGVVRDLRRQPTYVLSTSPKCVYTPDAAYFEESQPGVSRLVAEDVKGSAARDVFIRVAWLLNSANGVDRVRLLRRSDARQPVKRGWRRVAGWDVREYAAKTTRCVLPGAPEETT